MEGSGTLIDFDWSLRVRLRPLRPHTTVSTIAALPYDPYSMPPPPPPHRRRRRRRLQLVLSSSHLSSMRKPVLMVDLSLKYADGSTKNSVLEFNEGDLDSVLDSMSSVEKVRPPALVGSGGV